MYPVFRTLIELAIHRRSPRLPLDGVHVSHHRCMPWDLDMWMELNNGRTLTIYDLGRIPLSVRTGLVDVLKSQRWGLTMAGVSVRYRRRIRMFEKITMKSRAVYMDDKFIYLEQSMWRTDGDCANHALYRSAITSREGIVNPQRVLDVMGQENPFPTAPDWVAAWIEADSKRPWPPEFD